MKKKYIIILLIAIAISIFCVFYICKKHYDITEPPKKYVLKTDSEQKKYVSFIKNYIKPKKLGNFLNIKRIHFSFINEYENGNDALEWFKYEGYKELFYQMFDKKRNGYNDCPVTDNFKNKFVNNLFKYFKFEDVDDSEINCILSIDDKKIEITEMGDFNLGEPGYIFYHHFHYVLDDEGNVDDVIFDYTE